MGDLASKGGLRILESLSFTRTLYAFSFDGGLAPIVDNRDAAALGKETRLLLARLGKLVPTAVFSGRKLADLREKVPAGVGHLVGNHGLEGLPGSAPLADLRGQCESWREVLGARLGPVARELGISIEDKECSLAIHYRRSRRKKLARRKIQEATASLEGGPKLAWGKLVLNVIPPGAPHKGAVLQRLMEETGSSFALYVGADLTDEDVFGLLDPRILTVRVGSRERSMAKYRIRRQREIDSVLRAILGFHGAEA